MRKFGAWLIVVWLCAGPAVALEPQGKPVEDVWYLARIDGASVGHFHISVRELDRNGNKILRTALQMELTLRRNRAIVQVRSETGTEEMPDGKVVGVFTRQFLGNGQQMVLTGTVEEQGLHVQVDGGRIDKFVPWNPEVVGLYRQEQLARNRKIKPGDSFSFLTYEPVINRVLAMHVKVRPEEEISLLKGKQKLLPVDLIPDKIELPGTTLQLPTMTVWFDKKFQPVCRQIELDGLGKVRLYRTTRDVALKQMPLADLKPIQLKTIIPLNRPLAAAHAANEITYRITLKGDMDPASAFAQDTRQKIRNVQGNHFDMCVHAWRRPELKENPTPAKEEFCKSNYYIKSDDPRVKELATKAIGDETDAWSKAQRIERWIFRHMHWDDARPFVPADKVARDLAGDCRQCALLTAAMCRAAGVPSRTAIGMVYARDPQQGPVMAFHMWAEVWVQGQWVAIDGTLGQGSIGAAHIKITDHSWHNIESLTPLLPLQRVLGKVSIEVVSETSIE